MNYTQQYFLMHQAIDELHEARLTAWEIIDLGNPGNDEIGIERKLNDADEYLAKLERYVSDARDCLEGILVPESLSLDDVFGKVCNWKYSISRREITTDCGITDDLITTKKTSPEIIYCQYCGLKIGKFERILEQEPSNE